MAAKHSLGVPELAGVCRYEDAGKPGFNVDECVMILRRFDYVERRLFDLLAKRLTATPEWEIKCGFSLYLYLDGEHSAALRARVGEMRKPPLHLDVCPDPRLEALMEEALRAEDTVELLAGIYGIVRPALLAAYREYAETTHPLIDFPTRRALRLPMLEEEEAIAWGEAALSGLTTGDPMAQDRAEAWKRHLQIFIVAAGGIAGQDAVPDDLELPPARATVPFTPDFRPRRDARFRDSANFNYKPSIVARDPNRPMDERVLALMYKRLHEMDVPEMMASILAETPGKPWDYYREMGRQLWDEARHAMMGEIWFETHGIDWTQTPNHFGWSLLLNLERTPLERHAILFANEHELMGKAGKKYEWEIAQHSGDPLATYFQDFDWADEVLHKNIGLRWLKLDFKDIREMLAAAEDAMAKPHPQLDSVASASPQYDWWPDFARRVLGHYQPMETANVATMKGGLTNILKQATQNDDDGSKELLKSSG
jgi:hypothetical protein